MIEKSEKSTNPILNIPKIPFNDTHYQERLNIGTSVIEETSNKIILHRLHAPSNQPGSGFGMAKFREMVNKTIHLGCPGKIVTEASTSYGSPHLFYLYMGMVPDASERSYVSYRYGRDGVSALNLLNSKCMHGKSDTIGNLKDYIIKDLKWILCQELKIEKPKLDDIIKNKDFLLTLRTKKLDYVSEVFIPQLLEMLSEDPQKKYPDTRELGSVHMHLTTEGFERWKFCIENNFEFVPFKHFEHLNLTAENQQKLEEILNQRVITSANKNT